MFWQSKIKFLLIALGGMLLTASLWAGENLSMIQKCRQYFQEHITGESAVRFYGRKDSLDNSTPTLVRVIQDDGTYKFAQQLVDDQDFTQDLRQSKFTIKDGSFSAIVLATVPAARELKKILDSMKRMSTAYPKEHGKFRFWRNIGIGFGLASLGLIDGVYVTENYILMIPLLATGYVTYDSVQRMVIQAYISHRLRKKFKSNLAYLVGSADLAHELAGPHGDALRALTPKSTDLAPLGGPWKIDVLIPKKTSIKDLEKFFLKIGLIVQEKDIDQDLEFPAYLKQVRAKMENMIDGLEKLSKGMEKEIDDMTGSITKYTRKPNEE